MALILTPVLEVLMADQLGVAALTLLLRHRFRPPASMVLGLFGSRMNGAMKLAPLLLPASLIPE